MEFNDGMKIKRSDEAVWRIIDGEIVLLCPGQMMLHALTGCGSRVWELIEEETTLTEIVRRICDEYEVEPQTAREDVIEFIHKLEAIKLVDIAPAASEVVEH